MEIKPFETYSENEMCILYTLTQIKNRRALINKFLKEKLIEFDVKTNNYNVVDEKLKQHFDSEYTIVKPQEEEIVEQLMKLFPSGIKPGTSKSWRGNKVENVKKLEKLKCLTKQELDYSLLVNATKKYIESFNGDFRLMRTLPYFILKRLYVDGTVEYTSDLLSAVESLNTEESALNTTTQDWVSNLK